MALREGVCVGGGGGGGGSGKSPIPPREWEILMKGGTFSSGVENLSRSDFDHLNLFLKLKIPFCKY